MQTLRKGLLIGAVLFLAAGTFNRANAYYDRYPDGYWDRHGHWCPYVIYRHHRGYWEDRGGARIFITL